MGKGGGIGLNYLLNIGGVDDETIPCLYGDVTIPFVDRFPRGEIYNLLTTRPEDLKNEAKTE